MVNQVVYTGLKNKNTPKNEKNNNLLKTKRILNMKMSAKGGPVFSFSLPGGRLEPSPPRQLRHWSCSFFWLPMAILVLNLADWHAASLFHPPRVGHESNLQWFGLHECCSLRNLYNVSSTLLLFILNWCQNWLIYWIEAYIWKLQNDYCYNINKSFWWNSMWDW